MSHVLDATPPRHYTETFICTSSRMSTIATIHGADLIGKAYALSWHGHRMDISAVRRQVAEMETAVTALQRALAELKRCVEPQVIPIREVTDAPGTSP